MRSSDRRFAWVAVAVVVIVAVAVDAVMYWRLGWRFGGDTARYLDGAQRLIDHVELTNRQLGYIGYIAALAFAELLGLGTAAVFLLQLALSLVAALCAYGLGRMWFGTSAGLVCGVAWAVFVELQRWNFYLLTDGPFLSMVMICCFAVACARRTGGPGVLMAIAAIVVMSSLRINGLFFAVFFYLYLLAALDTLPRRLAVAASLAATLWLLPAGRALLGFVSHPATEGELARQGTYEFLIEGQVIWNTVLIPMPAPPPTDGAPRVEDLVAYVVDNPGAVAKLYVLRLGHYLFAYNPMYSVRHRLIEALTWTAIYGFATAGLRAVGWSMPWASSLPLLWIGQAALVMLTVGDFDGRYSLYAVPTLLPFAALACDRCLRRLGRGPDSTAAS